MLRVSSLIASLAICFAIQTHSSIDTQSASLLTNLKTIVSSNSISSSSLIQFDHSSSPSSSLSAFIQRVAAQVSNTTAPPAASPVSPDAVTPSASPVTPDAVTPSRNDGKIRGVNIGGWLVLEPFIRPSLFAQFRRGGEGGANDVYYLAQDEYTFCLELGAEEAQRQLISHYNNWFIESDMAALAASGLTHVRIPIGYWSIMPEDGEPYVQGALPFLLRAIEWAHKYDMKVAVDLHGAYGSQNGWNHSGRQGSQNWMTSPSNLDKTIEVLRELNRILTQPQFKGTVTNLEVVNEPFGMSTDDLKKFYLRAYNMLRNEENSPLGIAFSDSFRTAEFDGFIKGNNLQNAFMDQHTYHIFDLGSLKATREDKIGIITCGGDKDNVKRSVRENGPTFTGEWSLADTDCATWLNNVNVGHRYDNTYNGGNAVFGQCTGNQGSDKRLFTPDYIGFLQTWAQAQMIAFESGSGWFFWNFKTEGSPQWNFLLALQEVSCNVDYFTKLIE